MSRPRHRTAASGPVPAPAEPDEPDAGPPIYRFAHWEGPLDLLLELGREQKVDLGQVSILALADQYLEFITGPWRLSLEVAAEHLVMAAWLAYLKTRLLLPPDPVEDPSAQELASRLQERLIRLDAIRAAADGLAAREQIGRDVFVRGGGERVWPVTRLSLVGDLLSLARAYDALKRRDRLCYRVNTPALMSVAHALERLEGMLGTRLDWRELASFVPRSRDARFDRSAMASSFVAALELARQGRVALRQQSPFASLYIRAGEGL